jgi:hypothetical protein
MKTFARVVSGLALLATIVPPWLYLSGSLELAAAQSWMLAATVAWFVSASLWMDIKRS